jgi:cysteine-rich repeat protein
MTAREAGSKGNPTGIVGDAGESRRGRVALISATLILCLALSAGCILQQPSQMGIRPTSLVDADNDGYPSSGRNADCDDANPEINPGVVEGTMELCTDGVDNDCDKKIDGRDKDCRDVLSLTAEETEKAEPMSQQECGDGRCEASEDWQNCPQDCPPNPDPHPAMRGRLEIHHIDIGQGDATVLVSPGGKVVLFDSGESYWNSGADAERIAKYIQALTGGRHIDYYINSHLHLDHLGYAGYGGIWKLVEEYGFTIGKSYIRDYREVLGTTSGTYQRFIEWANAGGTGKLNLELVGSEDTPFTIDLGDGAAIDILYVNAEGLIPLGDYSGEASPPSENDFCMVAVVRYGGFDELIAGDLSGEDYESEFGYHYTDVESAVGAIVRDVEVYRVNHHGSSYSTNPGFLGAIDPEVSIVSVGNANPYAHPSSVVVERLKATSDVYMTQYGDRDGVEGLDDSVNYTGVVVGGDIVVLVTDPTGPGYYVECKPYGTAPQPVCGDGVVEGCEECDDGNTLAGDGCSPACKSEEAGHVVISEVAWMGTNVSAYDEWIELYNAGSALQSLDGWRLVAADGSPSISLYGTIPPGGYLLLERSDDTTVPEVEADIVYTGALSNTFEKLLLLDLTGVVVDETPSGDSWAAGDSSTRATMYRVDPYASSWATSTKPYSGGYGTPRTANM